MVEIRIHFTPEDVARIRLLPTMSPVFETVYAACRLAHDYRDPYFLGWLAASRAALGPAVRPTLAVLTSTFAQQSDLVSGRVGASLEASLDELRFIDRSALLAAVDDVRVRKLPPRSRIDHGLLTGDRARATLVLAAGLQRFWDVTLSPHWPALHQQASRTHKKHVETVGERGLTALFASLGAAVVWEYPVLRYPLVSSPNAQGKDVYLRGQGLLLVPSAFVRRSPDLWLQHTNPSAPPVLTYPVAKDLREAPWTSVDTVRSDRRLAALLGPTRAAVLRALSHGPYTTTQLAQQMHVSLATASEHAANLRDNGLTARHREGNRVYHSLTGLGRDLLAHGGGGQPASDGNLVPPSSQSETDHQRHQHVCEPPHPR